MTRRRSSALQGEALARTREHDLLHCLSRDLRPLLLEAMASVCLWSRYRGGPTTFVEDRCRAYRRRYAAFVEAAVVASDDRPVPAWAQRTHARPDWSWTPHSTSDDVR